jgi:hypothetical protein
LLTLPNKNLDRFQRFFLYYLKISKTTFLCSLNWVNKWKHNFIEGQWNFLFILLKQYFRVKRQQQHYQSFCFFLKRLKYFSLDGVKKIEFLKSYNKKLKCCLCFYEGWSTDLIYRSGCRLQLVVFTKHYWLKSWLKYNLDYIEQ